MPTKPVAKKANPRQTPSRQTRPEECVVQKKPAPDQNQGPPPFEGNAAGLPCSEEACTEACARQS